MGRRAGSTIDQKIGGRIRARRVSLGMSQGDLARAMGISFQQVQKYEKGVNRIGPDRLIGVAAALGVSVQYFFENIWADDQPATSDEKPANGADDFESQAHMVARSFSMIDDPQLRRNIVEFLAAIAASRKVF